MGNLNGKLIGSQEDRNFSDLIENFSLLGVGLKSREQKIQERAAKISDLMQQRWGPPGSPVYEMVMRYMTTTRMKQHWEAMGERNPKKFEKYLNKGYMEPIPIKWVRTKVLAARYPKGSPWETPAERRLYYLLNNGLMSDGSKHEHMRPLNKTRDRNTIIRHSNARNAKQRSLNAERLAAYRSPGDTLHNDKEIHSREYAAQVTNTVNKARAGALHELDVGIFHGTDHPETMLLIDVSTSMARNPYSGIVGPDGVLRYHDGPYNISLVGHLVRRLLRYMVPRAQKLHHSCVGIDTVIFSDDGDHIGQLSARNFDNDWSLKISLGGGTKVMQGWQVVKETYIERQRSMYGHGRYDFVYGWQPTPDMCKLSLLVFLDGEATDMAEFELELLGQSWAYVTIVLVGMENCPHHHSHAIELERVAQFNPHIGVLEVHGQVYESLVVEDILGLVYPLEPLEPPGYSETLKPEYDLPSNESSAYMAWNFFKKKGRKHGSA